MAALNALHAVTGRCACERVTFRCLVEEQVALCSCGLCRRNSGSAFQAWVNGQRASLEVTGHTSRWASTNHAERHFCPACGSTLFLFERDEPDVVEICGGSIDAPDGIVSARHGHFAKRPTWG